MSFDIDSAESRAANVWSGFTGYGSPVQISENVAAIIERRPGVELALWHLDFVEGTLKFIASFNHGSKSPTGFDQIEWHAQDSEIIGEFMLFDVRQSGSRRFSGYSIIGELNLNTGASKIKMDRVRHVNSEDVAIEKLSDRRRPRNTITEIPGAETTKLLILTSLDKRNLSFDFNRGRLVLAPRIREMLRRAVSDLLQTGQQDLTKIASLQSTVSNIPACPATRELSRQLELAASRLR